MNLEAGVVPHHWWAFALRGAAAVIFGVLAFAWPGLTLAALVLFFGAFALINGVLAIISAIRSRGDHVWLLVLEGAIGIIAGIVVFTWPGITVLLLVYFIAAWAIVTGVVDIIFAVRLRNVLEREWSWVIGGILSFLFGVLIAAQPGAGALALAWLIGIYAVLFGISLFVVAWRVYALDREEHGHPGGAGLHQPVAP